LNLHLPTLAAPSRSTTAILDLLHRSMASSTSYLAITGGLPAGARLLPQQQLALGGTVCTVPLFRDAMEKVAREKSVDVVVARHDTYPELLSAVVWDAALRVSGHILTLTNLLLFVRDSDDYWLVPSKTGLSLRFAADGVHMFSDEPFSTWDERCTGVCEAAKRIIKATRPGLEG
jgi:hypothetical protein